MLYLKTADESFAQRGDWFIVFIIGATLTKTFENTMGNYATTLRYCHLRLDQRRVVPDPAYT